LVPLVISIYDARSHIHRIFLFWVWMPCGLLETIETEVLIKLEIFIFRVLEEEWLL